MRQLDERNCSAEVPLRGSEVVAGSRTGPSALIRESGVPHQPGDSPGRIGANWPRRWIHRLAHRDIPNYQLYGVPVLEAPSYISLPSAGSSTMIGP
jgi:hypothetical protein